MKEPIVFLPGMMCDARLWMPQIVDLSADHFVLAAPITVGKSIEEIAKNVLLQLPDRFALAGLSLGGSVAMEMVRIAPERISRLALFDTSCQAELPNIAAAREPQIVGVRSGRLMQVMQDEMKPNYFAPGPQRSQIMAIVMEMALSLGPDVFIRQSRALQKRPDQQATLRKAKVPTLVACGEFDTLYPVRRHEFMAHLMPNAKLEVIGDAGHMPTLEQPEMTNQILREWLKY